MGQAVASAVPDDSAGGARRLSPYDESVPHVGPRPELAQRFAALRLARAALAPAADLSAARDVVVVVSSSRGGCTLLGELLRRCPSLLSLPAESNPYIAVAQLGGAGADELDAVGVVVDELALAVGRPAATLDAEAYTLEWAWRLAAQWPDLDCGLADARRWLDAALGQLTDVVDANEIATRLLAAARADGAEVQPGRYDLPAAEPPAKGPPGDTVVEMPPFVVPRPWERAGTSELATRTLILATPRNSYRLPFFRRLFPQARLRVLHLVRNPAAAVNGLIDGWHHHGFFNCRVPRRLAIASYSDAYPWGSRWWKYDVPPEWEQVVRAPLAVVCAEQWRSAHEAALAGVDELGVERYALRYEDLAGDHDRRRRAATALARWLGIPDEQLVPLIVAGLPPVMATVRPSPGRWRARARELAPVCADPHVRGLAGRLGYGDPETWR
jgi:hypothetical protein